MKNCNHVIGNLGRCIKCEEYERGYKDAICGTGNIKKEIEKAISQARSTALDDAEKAFIKTEEKWWKTDKRTGEKRYEGNQVCRDCGNTRNALSIDKILTSLHALKEK